MKNISRTILLGEGLGMIRFGMKREQVREQAGPPDEIEQYQHDESGDQRAEAWHYDDPEVSLAFEEFNNWRLTSIAISSDNFTLEGNQLIGMLYDEVLKMLQDLRIGEIDEDALDPDDGVSMKLITVEEAGLTLWFEDESLTEIQFSQIWTDEE